jgi:hypothetical protein
VYALANVNVTSPSPLRAALGNPDGAASPAYDVERTPFIAFAHWIVGAAGEVSLQV